MITDEELVRGLAHRQLRWNAPLSARHAEKLLTSLQLHRGVRIIDFGCGWAGLLLDALASSTQLTGVGLELDAGDLERAQSDAISRGLASRVKFLRESVVECLETADRAICIGAEYAWESVDAALAALHARVSAGGLMLFGCGYWTHSPSPKLVDLFGSLPGSLKDLISTAKSSGWSIVSVSSADPDEWDDFESKWNQDLDDISTGAATAERREQASRILAQRRDDYERGYRGVLSFGYLTLAKPG